MVILVYETIPKALVKETDEQKCIYRKPLIFISLRVGSILKWVSFLGGMPCIATVGQL